MSIKSAFPSRKSDASTPHPPGGVPAEPDIPSMVKLSATQLRAIELTTQGFSDGKIAEMLSVDPKTLWRWKTFHDQYRQVLANTRAQTHDVVADRYQNLVLRAAVTLAKFLDDPDENNRLRAAATLLNMAGCFKPAGPKPIPQYPPPKPRLNTDSPEVDLRDFDPGPP